MKPFKTLMSRTVGIRANKDDTLLKRPLAEYSVLNRLSKKKQIQLLVPELLPICMKFTCHI